MSRQGYQNHVNMGTRDIRIPIFMGCVNFYDTGSRRIMLTKWLWLTCFILLVFREHASNKLYAAAAASETVVFQRGEGGYYCIKIPSLLTTTSGTLIAFGEGRMFSCSDFTWTDLIYKRSTDNGKTWGPLTILYSNSSNASGQHAVVIGNAAPVVLRDSRRILLPFCRNNKQVMLTYSDDDGLSWSTPVNISGVVHPSWSWYIYIAMHHSKT